MVDSIRKPTGTLNAAHGSPETNTLFLEKQQQYISVL